MTKCVKKSREALIEMYKAIGVDYTKFTDWGECNVIIQSFTKDKEDVEDGDCVFHPLNYMPRKERACTLEFDMNEPDDKVRYIKELRNSAERMKMWAYLLNKQADEIENGNYCGTKVYYPEFDEYEYVEENDGEN